MELGGFFGALVLWFFGAPQAMPNLTAQECLCHLGAGLASETDLVNVT